ncbi:hypothetical protein [Gordonia liuliyuniae]|uniref:Uncharacterized protein n=1 Tax=Gordonia liuliyuniae TaxID=2911517 RepID=A0ABS9IT89_9ACTN|nr:hypothetical protein [Gordonia liuliyuniae]MCF8588782.1 hypothetical protein [Gordonia liuliyuniae]
MIGPVDSAPDNNGSDVIGTVVVGTAGGDPGALAAAIGGDVDADPACRCAVVVLDLSCDPGAEERELLAMLADRGTSTALVATRVERYPDWPALAERARDVLDPDRRLAMFAVSVATGGGLNELRQWCSTLGAAAAAGSSVPTRPPTEVIALASAEPRRAPQPAPTRADRLAGVRAGVTAARADVVTSAREAFQGLGVTAERVCGGLRPRDADAYTRWLSSAIAAVDAAAQSLLIDRLDRVHTVAALGLDDATGGPLRQLPPSTGTVPSPPERRPSAEDAVVLLFGVTAGFGVGRMLVTPMVQWAGLGWAGAVLTALTGLAVAAWIVGVRRTASVRAALRKWTADTVTLSRTAAEHRLVAQLSAVEVGVGRHTWNRMPVRRV